VYLWQPYLESLYHSSIGMPALGLKHVLTFVQWSCATSVKFSESVPLLESMQIILVISSRLLTSYFGGQSVTHQNYSLRQWPSVVVINITSVTFWSQVLQVSEKEYCHTVYVVPIMTSEGHLKHLKQLIWKKRNGLTKFINLLPLENPLKRYFWRGALPYTLTRSTGALCTLLGERYNALVALLGEHYLFWEKFGLLRRVRERSLQSLKAVGFESLVKP
jgi:hypothetical protein